MSTPSDATFQSAAWSQLRHAGAASKKKRKRRPARTKPAPPSTPEELFRFAGWQQIQRASRELTVSYLERSIEALVFAAPTPLSLRELTRVTKASRQLVLVALDLLVARYEDRGIHLVEGPGGWLFLTNSAYGGEVRTVTARKPIRMTRAQLEAMSIIAYRQPVTRPEMDEIRGVDSGPVLRTLLDRDLIRILGKKEEPGRPLLYGTTAAFLELLSLKSLADLPTLREFTELSDQSRDTYERRLGESAPAGAIVFDDEPDEPIDPTVPLEGEEEETDDEESPEEPDDGASVDGDGDRDDDEDGLEDEEDDLDDDEDEDDDLDDDLDDDEDDDSDLDDEEDEEDDDDGDDGDDDDLDDDEDDDLDNDEDDEEEKEEDLDDEGEET